MQNLAMPSSLMGHAAFDRRLASMQPPEVDEQVTIDLSGASFIRPSGIAHLVAIIYTLFSKGYDVSIRRPIDQSVDAYLQRTNFWGLLRRQGLPVPNELDASNVGAASNLIECTEIPTAGIVAENIRQTELLYDRFIRALQRANVEWRYSANVWNELCNNAAEHSLAPPGGAFVVAQNYRRSEIEIAIVDVGRGIRASLQHLGYEDDMAAVGAALQERISGRRDPAGEPLDGGLGLPSARHVATSLFLRSGTAVYQDVAGARDDEGYLIVSCADLIGTLVVAQVRA